MCQVDACENCAGRENIWQIKENLQDEPLTSITRMHLFSICLQWEKLYNYGNLLDLLSTMVCLENVNFETFGINLDKRCTI